MLPAQTIHLTTIDPIHQEKIVLFICAPSSRGIRVRVSSTEKAEIISAIFPGKKKILFHEGSILNPERSFWENGVKAGDRIMVVPAEQMSVATEIFWRKVSCQNIPVAKK
jgi:hypothetical protein